jgi:hypothetical protein
VNALFQARIAIAPGQPPAAGRAQNPLFRCRELDYSLVRTGKGLQVAHARNRSDPDPVDRQFEDGLRQHFSEVYASLRNPARPA